ncbi:MAG: Holliday junction resolvase RuvX [Pseudomonadota bacterium]|jgi:putative Holliday junction resolvase
MSTVLAFDFGLKRIGVAVGNTLLRQATPLAVIAAASNENKFAAIGQLLEEWQPSTLVVGLPLHPDGAEHAMSQRCRRFANQLHGRYALPAVLVDERYTSAVFTQRRGVAVDSEAAALILQQYFDQHEPN